MRPGLERLRAADAALEHPPDVEAEQDEARDRGVEERRLRAQQPAARGELREEQDRQRAARAAAGDHHERDAQDVARQQRRHERRQAERQRLALDDPERDEPEDEIERRVREEQVRRRNAEHLEVEEHRRAEQRRAADRAIDPDDPQDPPARFGLRHRRRKLLDGRREGRGRHHGSAWARAQRRCRQAGSPQVGPDGPGMASFCGRYTPQRAAADHRLGGRRRARAPARVGAPLRLGEVQEPQPEQQHDDDDADPEQDLRHGAGRKIFPGLKRPAGSSAALTVRIRSISTALL